jgi:glycosyltransferase involved in cell wall biosynthesis
MPSFHETFGLVYIEAMTQGLPVLYTRGEGIDGYFEQGQVGYCVDPHDVNDIADKIELTLSDYDSISRHCFEAVDNFSWHHIARHYESLYSSLDSDEPVER